MDLFFPEPRKRNAAPEVPSADELDADLAEDAAEPRTQPTSTQTAAENESATPAGAPARKAPEHQFAAGKGESPAAEDVTDAQEAEPKASPRERKAVPDVGREVEADRDSGVDLVEVPGVRFAEIPVTDIHPNRKQPRSVFDEDDMAELVHSVREIGVLQPIVVRTSTEEGGEPYELVMGERRWRAVQAAGLETIPAIVRDTTDDDLLRDALLENLHRSQLNPLEEAAAYQQLLEDFGTTHEQLADRIGRSRPQVSNTLRLLKLPPLVQRRVAASVISAGHARALLALPDAAAMERMAQKIVSEGMSVRATEEAVTLYQNPASNSKNNIPRPGARHERLDYLASSLSDRLDTNVKISLGARKGRVSIEFASVEDLNRIMDVLAPGPSS
ncbi:ParB family chromosome partitioning protein [Arthrobacter sp. V4I6]|uniref:ParB/RepB/Spo0J family partition protein n=1 Tax=Arthrobacter sp. V4I6 TaxID=3042281 RepID=UPI0027802334|nr:ParB/RepB/Spo0J family partition protein [Arthrobacter sp. V4I6]MDQ0853072.1 ParB family chromosome partitioning protein [Arthrobacter sp. V4I6]